MNNSENTLLDNDPLHSLTPLKIKPQSILIKPDLVIDTDTTPLHKKPKKAKKSILKDSSIITYTGKLRAFHLRMTGLPLSADIINAIQGNDYDKKVVITKDEWNIGDYVEVEITDCTQVSLFGNVIRKIDL